MLRFLVMCSPIDHLGKDLLHVRILFSNIVDNCLNGLIPLALLFEVGAGLIFGNGGLESVGSDSVVLFTHHPVLLFLEKGFRLIKLSVEELELGLSQSLAVILVVILFVVDVLGNVVDLALPSLNGCVELHGLLCSVLQVLLEVCDLTRQLALGGTILSVLFLDLGEVLELDCLALEDTPLHILDQLLLLLTEEFILELHSMDLLFHGDDLSLTNGWVKSVLHLFL